MSAQAVYLRVLSMVEEILEFRYKDVWFVLLQYAVSSYSVCVLGSGGFGFMYLLIYLYMELFSAVVYIAN